MKRNAPRVNNPARLARLRDQAIKLRERVKRSTLAFHERIQARLAWWQRAFRVPLVADWAIFTKAKTLLTAFMALLGLASSKKSSLVALMVEGPVPQTYPGLMKMQEMGDFGGIRESETQTNDRSLLPGTPGRRAGDEGALFPSDSARRLQPRSSDIRSSRKPEMRNAHRKSRRPQVEGLEQRQLMATFQQSDSVLNLDLTTASTTLAVTAEANNYTLTLTGGDTWTSSNITGATGSGSTTLIVTKDTFTTINVTDSNTGAAVNFNNSAANTYIDNLSVVLDDSTAARLPERLGLSVRRP